MSSRKRATADTPEALRWFNRFRMKGPTALSPDESAKWARWAADKAHLDEFRRVEALWDNLKQHVKPTLPTQQELDADRYDPEKHSVSEWLERNG